MTSVKSTNDRLSYGITILLFGVVFLLDKLGILAQIPYAKNLMSVWAFFLIGAIVFIATQPKKILGWVFLVIAILLNLDLFFGWMKSYSYLIVPLGLIIGGIAMILTSKKKK
ncbi:MAG: hypothetical protein E6767_13205 [Dysgonomonas sp.]|nr:hypothetical protein [Dysgonomonas sp.]